MKSIYPVWQSHILTSNLPCPPKKCGNWIKTPRQGQGPAKITMLGLTLIRLKVRCWRAAAWWFPTVPDTSSGQTCEEILKKHSAKWGCGELDRCLYSGVIEKHYLALAYISVKFPTTFHFFFFFPLELHLCCLYDRNSWRHRLQP